LAEALQAMGHRISHHAVADLLRELNYSLQSNRKTLEGTHNPDRDAQFSYINAKVAAALAVGEPAISVGTKKRDWSALQERRPRTAPQRRARPYPSGIKVTDAEMSALNIQPHEFHAERNYTIAPAAV
jgi:hypothetical protein